MLACILLRGECIAYHRVRVRRFYGRNGETDGGVLLDGLSVEFIIERRRIIVSDDTNTQSRNVARQRRISQVLR